MNPTTITCAKCGLRYSWLEKRWAPPPCPGCGNKPSKDAVADARIARQYSPEATPLLPGLEVRLDRR